MKGPEPVSLINFLLRSNTYVIRKCLPDFHIIAKPAIKLNISLGRPINGMFIAIPSLYKDLIQDISPINHCVQEVLLKINTQVILIVNTYFPTDSPNNINIENIQETIEAVNTIIQNNNFHKAFITGDINCNFKNNSPHVNYVNNFLENNNFVKSWNYFHADFTHVHEANNLT